MAVLTIYFNKKQTLLMLPILLYVLTILILIYTDRLFNISCFGEYISVFLHIVIGSSIAIWGGSVLYACYMLVKHAPVAVFDHKGIWINHYGFFEWCDIEDVDIAGMPGEYIGIRIKSFDKLFQQSSYIARSGLFIAKIFRFHHITLANLNVSSERVICFARYYLDKSNS